jgi:hypothetical protein
MKTWQKRPVSPTFSNTCICVQGLGLASLGLAKSKHQTLHVAKTSCQPQAYVLEHLDVCRVMCVGFRGMR